MESYWGQGSGGFSDVLCPMREHHERIEAALNNLRRIPIRFEPQGAASFSFTTEMSGAFDGRQGNEMTAPTVAKDAAGCMPDKRANCMHAGIVASNSMAQMKDIR